MSSPTGTSFPGAIDNGTAIGTSVSPGDTIASAYANTQSSAILALEAALAPNPGITSWKQPVRLATAAALPSNSYNGTDQTLTPAAEKVDLQYS